MILDLLILTVGFCGGAFCVFMAAEVGLQREVRQTDYWRDRCERAETALHGRGDVRYEGTD